MTQFLSKTIAACLALHVALVLWAETVVNTVA
jgi:hypothetical protein